METHALLLFGALFLGHATANALPASTDVLSKDTNLEECLRADSVACVQLSVFRTVRGIFEQKSIDLLGGVVSLVREEEAGRSNSGVDEQQVLEAKDVESREAALESYLMDRILGFFQERSFRWNIGATARNLAERLPDNVKEKLTQLVTEGRRKKKILKSLLPILLGLKIKAVGIILLLYLATALIAKKALLVSLASLALSGFVTLRKLIAKRSESRPHHESYHAIPVPVGYHGPASYGGYDSSAYGHAEYVSHSSPVAHNLAYGAQKGVRRR